MDGKTLYLVIPCYNEEKVLGETKKRLKEKMSALLESGRIAPDSKVLFVNDGSKDRTWQIIQELNSGDKLFRGVSLSRNKGHQTALYAGLMVAKEYCDVAISLDSDLQDDVNAIDEFLDRFYEGNDIVYGVRKDRTNDSGFKRATAESYYKLLGVMGVNVVFNHADYRLMSKRALDALAEFREFNLFLRGMVPTIGFKTATVEYVRFERFAGESKYPLKKMLALAWDGITSFSTTPIKMITIAGFVIMAVSALSLIGFLIAAICGKYLGLWPLNSSIWLLGSLILTAIGIIGEYVGKNYSETKRRPRYFIDRIL